MILVDFSSIIHRMVHSSSKEVQPKEKDGKYVTSEYAPLMIYYIFNELINVQMQYQHEYGEMVLLFDDWSKKYWRKDFYPAYKDGRSKEKAKNKINYTEVFEYVNALVEQLETNTPWRCVTVPEAEADDTILILSREFSKREKICIYSPDKDMIQAQRWTENVFQYSPLTKKWLVPELKHDSMEHWTMEHVMLGDESDGVPKVVAHCDFTDVFKEHLNSHGVPLEFHEVKEFKHGVQDDQGNVVNILSIDQKLEILNGFNHYKRNKKGEETELDIYKDVRFGPSTLDKKVKEYGSLDEFIDSHPMYREHYDRNFKLVMEEGIPEYIWENTLTVFNESPREYNYEALVDFLESNNLHDIISLLPKVFKQTDTLSIENCGWI